LNEAAASMDGDAVMTSKMDGEEDEQDGKRQKLSLRNGRISQAGVNGDSSAASSSSSSSPFPPDAASKQAEMQWRAQKIAFTTQLLATLSDAYVGKSSNELMNRVRRVVELMEEDQKRMEEDGQPSLIDLNLADPTTGRDIPMGCIELHWLTLPPCELNEEQRKESHKLFTASIHPYILKRLNDGEYDVQRKDAEGWTTLTPLARRFILDGDTSIDGMAECLSKVGANVDEKNPTTGATPLIMQAGWVNTRDACGLQFLLNYGADVNARSNVGDTFMHWLVRQQNLPVLRRLYAESANHMLAIDYTIKNDNQETALEMAERKHREGVNGRAKKKAHEVMMLIQLQHDLWRQQVPPYIHSLLQHSFLLPDLATIVTSYITG